MTDLVYEWREAWAHWTAADAAGRSVKTGDKIDRSGEDRQRTPGISGARARARSQGPRGRTAAHDAVLDLARCGVLDGRELGRQAALLLTDDLVVGLRVSGGLTECARAGDAAVLPILEALQEVASVLPGRRDAGAFLELAAELAERTGHAVDLLAEFHALASGTSSSMLAKAARRLLEV